MSFIVKKIGVVSMTAAALLVASWGAQAAGTKATDPSTTVVHVTASVVGETCTPDFDETGVNVDMGKIAATSLADVDQVGSQKLFAVHLTGCASDSVTVSASGPADGKNPEVFANTAGASAAPGVGVSLWAGEGQGTQLSPAGSNDVTYNVVNSDANMQFLAKVQRTDTAPAGDDDAANGSVKSDITLNMAYN